jgi:DNA-binding NarL/FixJ family response regulator
MEEQHIKILMVDDHPMIIEGYQNTIMATKKDYQILHIDIATTCDMANDFMKKSLNTKSYDLLFFDIKLPPSRDGLITSGEDLAKISRKLLPNAKVIILTMFNEALRIHNIIKQINPEGLLIKSDLTSSELAEAFQIILTRPPYYSSTVSELLNKAVRSDIIIDDINRKILHLLSQGVKTNTLIDYINMSMSGIEKRKKHLKLLFDVEDGKDETLLNAARKKGFL